MSLQEKYEAVIGLEVHAQLATQSKLFCGDSTRFGAAPNTQVSPITLGHPGTLPKTNKKAVAFAIKMGLACHCEIEKDNYFARKNYFYPDLPKGYQISQHTTPICKGGYVTIHTSYGRKDDKGKGDLYMSIKDASGKWQPVKNLSSILLPLTNSLKVILLLDILVLKLKTLTSKSDDKLFSSAGLIFAFKIPTLLLVLIPEKCSCATPIMPIKSAVLMNTFFILLYFVILIQFRQ